MGAEFWSYFVPYQADQAAALEALRQKEFEAGRYWQPSVIEPGLWGRMLGRAPAAPKRPKSIREAIRISDATGTRSILDMERVGDKPDYGTVTPVPRENLLRWFGTDQPTREMLERCDELYDSIERGHGISIVTYRDGKPEAIYFAGYSYD